jgi:hypothetical protein
MGIYMDATGHSSPADLKSNQNAMREGNTWKVNNKLKAVLKGILCFKLLEFKYWNEFLKKWIKDLAYHNNFWYYLTNENPNTFIANWIV